MDQESLLILLYMVVGALVRWNRYTIVTLESSRLVSETLHGGMPKLHRGLGSVTIVSRFQYSLDALALGIPKSHHGLGFVIIVSTLNITSLPILLGCTSSYTHSFRD